MITKKKKFGTFVVKFTLLLLTIVIVAFIIFAGSLVVMDNKLQKNIYPHVFIDKKDFGSKSKEEVISYYDKKNNNLSKLQFTVLYQNEPAATFSGQQIKLRFDSHGIADRAYLIGRSSNQSSRLYQKLAALLNLQRFDFTSTIEYDPSAVRDFTDNQEGKYNKPAKNALFSFENGRVVTFRQEEKGLQVESDKLLADFAELVSKLKTYPQNQTFTLTSQVIEPEITLAKANNFGIEELLAVGKSDYSHSIPGRIHNVILATSKFNGVLIPKDAIFSFNDTVGDISQTTGYDQAYIIKSGKTVLGDGGGVCQVSTTLFRAALNAGLPIVERTAHAYRVGYYESDSKPGFDATVFGPTVDLKIKNDTPAYILIKTEIDQENNLLYFKFYGKKDDRKVEISPVVVSDPQEPPPPLYQDDPTLKKGVVKQIDFAAWGSKVYFSYKVTKDNTVSFAKTFYSNFRPWQAIYLVGQAD